MTVTDRLTQKRQITQQIMINTNRTLTTMNPTCILDKSLISVAHDCDVSLTDSVLLVSISSVVAFIVFWFSGVTVTFARFPGLPSSVEL